MELARVGRDELECRSGEGVKGGLKNARKWLQPRWAQYILVVTFIGAGLYTRAHSHTRRR